MLNENFDLSLIVTTEANKIDEVPHYAIKNNISFISVKDLNSEDLLSKLKDMNAEVAVLGYFGRIVPQSLLSIFPKGIVNIHPSLLPSYRGPTPVQTAIINGEKETGTTLIVLDKDVDHGPILAQEKMNILDSDTTDTLHTKLFALGAKLIEKILKSYVKDELSWSEQNHHEATFTKHLSKSDGQIDIENLPSKDKLDRMIRAYYPWPAVWTIVKIKNKELRIKLLPEKKIQVEGGKPMSVKDFLNGYPEIKEIINIFKS